MSRKHASPSLADLAQQLRLAAGISVYELAKRSGLNRSTLLRIEAGDIGQPGTDTLNALARGLGIDPEQLYDAAWQEGTPVLPSPATYLRSKYRLSAVQIAQLEAQIKKATAAHGSNKHTLKHERRSP